MNSPALPRLLTWDWRWGAVILLAVLIGLNAPAVAGNPGFWIGLAGLVLYGLLLRESIRNPMVFVFTFLAVLILLPPFFSAVPERTRSSFQLCWRLLDWRCWWPGGKAGAAGWTRSERDS